MNKIEFLAASLPYCLYSYTPNRYEKICLVYDLNIKENIVNGDNGYFIILDNIIPIIRPFSDLTKECVQSNYNDGKPFIPIVELAKEYYSGIDWGISEYGYCVDMKKKDVRFILEDNTFYLAEDYHYVGNIDNPLSLYQKLIRFHFWPNMKEDENVIYVTDDFNPYK